MLILLLLLIIIITIIIIYIWDYEGYMWIIETTDPKWHAHLSRDSKKLLSV